MVRALLSLLLASLLSTAPALAQPVLSSAHAIVIDEGSGEVLLGKDVDTAAPIASLTKLLTAMVVLDAAQDDAELLQISDDDLDRIKHTRSGVPVGAQIPRGHLMELALIASDNRAASALARHHPGGMHGFIFAMRQKIDTLGLQSTLIEEPTGLSPNNRASALDFARVLAAAAQYPQIERITSRRTQAVQVDGRPREIRNTNGFVGAPGWHILLSKTGFTREAGRCLSMRLQAAGRTVSVVLLGAVDASERAVDAMRIHRWLGGEPEPAPQPAPKRRKATTAQQAAPQRAA